MGAATGVSIGRKNKNKVRVTSPLHTPASPAVSNANMTETTGLQKGGALDYIMRSFSPKSTPDKEELHQSTNDQGEPIMDPGFKLNVPSLLGTHRPEESKPTEVAKVPHFFSNQNLNARTIPKTHQYKPTGQAQLSSPVEEKPNNSLLNECPNVYTGTSQGTSAKQSQESDAIDAKGPLRICPQDAASHSGSAQTGVSSRSTLDLKNNDNSFHVLANLMVDLLHPKVNDSRELVLLPEDRQRIERLLPPSARINFIQAVQHRLNTMPANPTTPLQFLTLQCKELCLDQEGSRNPILASMALTGQPVYIFVGDCQKKGARNTDMRSEKSENIDDIMAMRTAESSVLNETVEATPTHHQPLQTDETPGPIFEKTQQHPMQPQRAPSIMNPFAAVGSAAFVSQAVVKESPILPKRSRVTPPELKVNPRDGTLDTEVLARQQLLAELREASTLMAESKTPETASFWRDHVLDLQARLRALHRESPTAAIVNPQSAQKLLDQSCTIKSNDAKIQRLGQYVPPARTSNGKPLIQTFPGSNVYPSEAHGKQRLPMVDVVSPADLPSGYCFEAEMAGKRFLATVPSSGVQQGETFTCAMRDLSSVDIDIPIGHWKDKMYDVCKHGCFHAAVWNSTFCPLLALSQIETRLNLDFLGRPEHTQGGLSNRITMFIVTLFWLCMNGVLFTGFDYKWSQRMELSYADWSALALVNLSMFGFVVFVSQSTRSSLRERFMIREQRCYDLEDLWCSTFCLPCAISQMHRHTANYDDYEAICCSKNGLPHGVRLKSKVQPPQDGSSYLV
jgi:Cys-rich protein (TIGR01571 family)